MSKAAAFLAEFETELKTTRRFLERTPAEKLAWKPHEKSMTAGQLALHIAQTPMSVLKMCLQDQVSPPDVRNGFEQPATLAAITQAHEQGAAFVRATLPTVDDARMARIFSIAIEGRTIMAVPRESFIRSIMLNHWYHHRGQFGVYLRLMGALVPSSYGPSGDESPF